MTTRHHTRALLASARDALPNIEKLYKNSLAKKDLDLQLLVQIKNLLENLRSALDYLAQNVFDCFCTSPTSGKAISVYFPILRRGATPTDFANFANGRFPGLRDNAPAVYECFESYQFYKSPANEWLLQFNDLCQQNKHEQLSPQTRHEERGTRFSDKTGASVTWNEGVQFGPGGSLVFKPGGKLRLGPGGSVGFTGSGMRVLGRPVDPHAQAPAEDAESRLKRIAWVDFRFDSVGTSVFPFLRDCVDKVSDIVDRVRDTMGTEPKVTG